MSESTALAVRHEEPTALAQGGIGFEDTFIQPEFIELVQRTTTREGATPGKFYDVLTGEQFEKLSVVPLAVSRGRVLFPEDGQLGAEPICRSDDGYKPSPFAMYPQSNLCGTCPKGTWDNYDRKTGKGKPPCKEKWQLTFIMKDLGLPRKMNFGGTALTSIKNLMKQLKQFVIIEDEKLKREVRELMAQGMTQEEALRNAKTKRLNIYDFSFDIAAVFVQGNKGSYYVPKFTNVKRVQELGEFGPLYIEYVAKARERRERAAQQAAAQTAEQAVGEVIDAEVVDV